MGTTIETDVVMGNTYTDKDTGLVGVAVCITKWQHGCIRIGLQPGVGRTSFVNEVGLEGITPYVRIPVGVTVPKIPK